MSARLSSVGRWLGGALLAGAVCLVIVDQNAITRLRAEQQALSAEAGTARQARQARAGQPDLATLRTENEEVKKLELATRDLPRLRNEIGRLRTQATELERLRAENHRLTGLRDGAATAPVLEGFIGRDALIDAGLSTPEAAVQTVFSAMTRGNLARLDQCMADPGEFTAPPTEEARKQMMDGLAKFPGFRITGTINNSPTEAQVEIQTSADGTVMGVLVVRIGNEWKVAKMGL